MRWIFCFVAIGLMSVVPASARLGETFAQAEKRYGKQQKSYTPLSPAQVARVHKKGQYAILLGFLDGKAAYMEVQRIDKRGMSEDEIFAVLKAHDKGMGWQKNEGAKDFSYWQRDDGEVMAAYDPVHKRLFLQTREFFNLASAVNHGS